MFGIFRKNNRSEVKPEVRHYDPAEQKPVIRCSICTGEQVAGFRDLKTGKFLEIQLIRKPGDLERFMQEYGLTEEPEKIY